jgi:glycine oxidase
MQPDIIVIGAGVIGSAIAYELARRTAARITVVERGVPGCEASGAAAGLLGIASTRARDGALFRLRRTSAQMYPDWVGRLEEETGHRVGFQRAGTVSVALSEGEAGALRSRVVLRRSQGFSAESLDTVVLRELEPAVTHAVCGAALFAEEARVHPRRLVAALVEAAVRRGVRFRPQTTADRLSTDASSARVRTNEGSIDAAYVVVAAGAWASPLLEPAGVKVPLRPARGEMIALRSNGWGLKHVLSDTQGFLATCGPGEVVVGSTTAFVGFDKCVTAGGVAALREYASRLVPAARDTVVARRWAGLRPCPTIRRPLITPLPDLHRVFLATGHHRNGILLAPVTAHLMTDLILGETPVVSPQPFGYRRR